MPVGAFVSRSPELIETASLEAVDEFVAEGLITEVVSTIKSGKEATAYLCRGTRKLGAKYAVAKVYHDRTRRNFANDTAYEVGDRLLKGRVARAVANKTDAGRAIHAAVWVDHEFETLSELAYAGIDVPEPYAATEQAILMAYIGDNVGPAPQLRNAQLDAREARGLLDRMLWSIETMLGMNVIHGDLSPFNILYWDGRLWIIDLPQAVDPRFNKRAREFLARDVRNTTDYWKRYAIGVDAEQLTSDLWRRFTYGELG